MRTTDDNFRRLLRATLREILVLLVFCLFTALLTWPYVTRLRDVVVDKGDPYLIAWILWWDYHATFTNPLHLFDANIFYPLKYTLAFSEHSYGISLLFFPFYFIGLSPLTVHAIALFFGFALSGYGAFRLGRTLTGSAAVGWVSGIIFAFVPYRFNMMSQVAYVFSPWVPLVFEALVLFARNRSRKHAIWLGCAFFMNGLTTITWFTFTLIPFVLFAAILLTRYGLWRNRDFYRRAGVALAVAAVALLPFMIPYVVASRLYGFKRTIEEIKTYSALPIHWLGVERRNKLWNRMGEGIADGWKFPLFPGLLPILFSLTAVLWQRSAAEKRSAGGSPADVASSSSNIAGEPPALRSVSVRRWLPRLDAVIIALFALSLLAIGFDHSDAFYNFFDNFTSERTLAMLTIAILIRLCVAYPSFLHTARPNLVETIRSDHRSDAFWLGSILVVLGFCFSLGWNFFFFRICYQLLPMFKSMRVVARGAMLAYLGLALLSGLGVQHLAEWINQRYPRFRVQQVFIAACALLLLEFNAAPLDIVRGDPFPDAVTLRLKQTPMRGGIAYLPAGGDNNYRYMLRAADHQKPLIVGTSGFNSPIENRIEGLTYNGHISDELMTLLESVPASYLVIANNAILPERMLDYHAFLARQLSSSRLRFINRFDGHDDLYAVVKNEPQARSEASIPFDYSVRDWSSRINDDPIVLLSEPLQLSQRLYRVYLVTSGKMPRYEAFKSDLDEMCRDVIFGSETEHDQFVANFLIFVNDWAARKNFTTTFGSLSDAQYVDQLTANGGIQLTTPERSALIDGLANGKETRASVLLKIADDARLVQKEQNRSLVALHYFAYLRRNPDDAPDGDLRGFDFWVGDQDRRPDMNKLSTAFRQAWEYEKLLKRH